jgi:glycosyltransferase involved in cell wall biosynthesis
MHHAPLRPEILLDARWLHSGGPRNVLGLARVGQEIVRRIPPLERLEGGLPLLHPVEPFWLTGVLGKRRPRLFYSPGFNAPPTSPVPFVFTIFDLIHLHIDEESSAGKRLYYRLHVKPAVRRARAVLTGSEYSRADIVEWSGVEPERVVVIRSAAASSFTPDGDAFEPGYPYLLYVGNRKPHKNLARLVRALDRIDPGHPLRLILPGPVDPGLASLARDVGVGDRLVFLGQVADTRLPALYRGALAFVFPSLHEGFGLPPLEAMACGTPVVSSLATSLAEVVGDAALAIDPLDIDSIATGIDRVASDSSLRSALRELGLAQAARFSWDDTAGRTWSVLQAALEGAR